MVDSQKEVWVEEHARRMQRRFEQWQKPLGITSEEYLDYLREELSESCSDPLIRSLIESLD
jgi:hypothetical protein